MSDANPANANGPDRRLLLVDFDWQDADLLPELLQHPGVSVGLVAGAHADDAGIRLAELCGLPRTLDLADLTREIFDVALVSERSPRRAQIEGLLLAFGTPSVTPQSFLSAAPPAAGGGPPHTAAAPSTVPFEAVVAGEELGTLLEEALPDVSTESPSGPAAAVKPSAAEPAAAEPAGAEPTVSREAPAGGKPAGEPPAAPAVVELPSASDQAGLEGWLRRMMGETGATRAEIHLAGPGEEGVQIELGSSDALLGSLVGLARQLGGPQVVGGLTGQQAGKAWGAWPFRTLHWRGLVAAGGIDPVSGWMRWERAVGDLSSGWDRRERELAAPAFPMLPERFPRWLDAEDFGARLELAIERNRRDGLRFAVHYLTFAGPEAVVATLFEQLPGHLRDMDCLTRPSAHGLLLLTAATPDGFAHARRRLLSVWQEAWAASGQPDAAPEPGDLEVHLSGPGDETAFLAMARGWLTGA